MQRGILNSILIALAVMTLSSPARAFEPFVINQIQVAGLQRMTDGTVLNYLPVGVGDEMTPKLAKESIRALFKTEFFRDVKLEHEGRTLIVTVEERPTIASFDIEGNKKLGGDEIKKGLAEAGLAEGKIFRRLLIDQISQEMRRQYYSNGFYGVEIDSSVEELPNNRVAIKIDVDENDTTLIRKINVVGNEHYDDDELLDTFVLQERSLRTLIGSKDQYSQEKLFGDLEGLTAFYQNRGYVNFAIESVQVAISPDMGDMYISVNVNEGEQFTVGEYSFDGDLIVPEAELRDLLIQKPGDVFSLGNARFSANRVRDTLANQGYAFAEVEPQPSLDAAGKRVNVVFNVQPGRRVYVRRINFIGNEKTNDETLRREMRLLEGGLFATGKLQLSRTRIARLPYIEDVQMETFPVANSDDLVDVEIKIAERAPGSIQFGVGFSGSQGFLINGSVTHTNFRGQGDRISATLNRSETTDLYRLSYTDPYYTQNGVSRTISGFYRQTDGLATTLDANFSTDSYGASLGYSFPLSENNSWNLGFGYRETAMFGFQTSPLEVQQFLIEEGSRFTTITTNAGWSRDTRNRSFFPTRGMTQSINANIATPLGDLEYYRVVYDLLLHKQIVGDWTIAFSGDIGYADTYGGSNSLPPYENFFAGGPSSVRGFEAASLGPRETPPSFVITEAEAYGGKFRTVASAELILPTPLKSNNRSTRATLFVDSGNVFAEPSDWDAGELRTSTGVAFYWLTPILGLLRFSYAFPLTDQPGDEIERFQFTFGLGF